MKKSIFRNNNKVKQKYSVIKYFFSFLWNIEMYKVKLIGAIKADWGEKYILINRNEQTNLNLKDILLRVQNLQKEKFMTYFDPDLTPKRGTIIIINGTDYNAIGGINALISPDDEIIFIPTISGG